ncbi:hypothetical protein [Peredibacter starrii]|uniref:DUF1553 domain-containing protein n=1 Tax=Peredibacter starrii TaxID=28202 RepID=A0AAX4HRW6_9BACT|nr:hypothetical protein [Peredibacter starrii]WPU66118.1 hypothetical protein SOO65_05105 [Peredibacter starrii]
MLRSSSFILALLMLAACQPAQEELKFDAPNALVEKQQQLNYASEIQMADRAYVESVLLQIFNASGTSAATYIQSDIYQKVEFGGACDFYSTSDLSPTTVEFPREQCYTGMGVVQNPNNNPMRYSLTTKVCERLVVDSARMDVVKAKIFSNNQWEAPSDASIQRAWSLFFPIESASPAVVKDLKAIADVSSGNEDAWKNIILTMCISPEWQVL